MTKETVEEFLARGGKIQYIPTASNIWEICPDIQPDKRARCAWARRYHRQGMSIEDIATKYKVEIKTVERWINAK